MSDTILLYGPPGTGKSRTLVQLFLASAKVSGPEKVGAITFTRAGAEELRSRLARELGVQGDQSYLKKRLPWVGTIHSLCFRRLGCSHKQMVTPKRQAEFCQEVNIEMADDSWRDFAPDELDEPFVGLPEYGAREITLLTSADAMARHRMWPFRAGVQLLEMRAIKRANSTVERLCYLKQRYDLWKAENEYLDYQDLLEQGRGVSLPVHTLLVDEVQDNSPLLFSVADAWGYGPGVVNYALAGDPYQAIYKFAGGDPDLFLKHRGRWHTIGNSYRLSADAADYAKMVLGNAGWDDPRLETWTGIGGNPVDGSTLYLGRTNNIVNDLFREPLIRRGVPFTQYRGRAPLDTNAGLAYKFLHQLSEGLELPGVDVLTRALTTRGVVPPGQREKLQAMKLSVSAQHVEQLFGRKLPELMAKLQYSGYFEAILEKYGPRGLYGRPKVAVSTIHGAKGREADIVVLARSWATRPSSEVAMNPKPESLVAYVATSRHRKLLRFFEGGQGTSYPFPGTAEAGD